MHQSLLATWEARARVVPARQDRLRARPHPVHVRHSRITVTVNVYTQVPSPETARRSSAEQAVDLVAMQLNKIEKGPSG